MAPQLTTQTLRVLAVFLEDPGAWHYGLGLATAAKLPPGSIYAILRRLARAELLERHWEDIDPRHEARPRRRLYRLTPTGQQVARSELEEQITALRRASPRPRLSPRVEPA